MPTFLQTYFTEYNLIMKKTTSLARAALFVLLALFTSVGAWADDDSGSCGTNVTYSYVESTGTLTISGTGPSEFKALDHNFYNNILTVVIENGVTTIGNEAFTDCTNLTSITIPNSLTSIGLEAFYDCSGLTSITIPSSVTDIGYDAFYGCINLTDVYCLADPEKLIWEESDCDDFVPYVSLNFPTKCHVADQAAFEAKWSTGDDDTDVNVEFVGDLAVLEDAGDNLFKIKDLQNQTKTVAISGRTLKAGHWSTICLPFALDADQMNESFGEGAVVKEFSSFSVEDNNLKIGFAAVTAMKSGYPYIVFIPEGSDIINPVFKDVQIAKGNYDVYQGGTDFVGTYISKGMKSNPERLILKDDKLYYPTADITINAFRCYFVLDTPAPALASEARVIIDWGDDEEATGIASMEDGRSQMEDVWYTLDGRKLDGKPSVKGIYMYNGKKVAVQ